MEAGTQSGAAGEPAALPYRRVLLKLSGELLAGDGSAHPGGAA